MSSSSTPRDFKIGGINENEGPFVRVQENTYAIVTRGLADTADATETRIQLDFAGPQAFDLKGATVSIEAGPKWSVALRGTSTNFIGVTGSKEVDVLVLFDWTSESTDADPSLIVFGRASGFTLADVLKLGPEDPLGGAGLDSVMFTTGKAPSRDPDTDTEHIAHTSNQPDVAVEFLEGTYGTGDVPTPVPAMIDLDGSLFISASVDTDFLPDVAKDVLGLPVDGRALLEGTLGIKLRDDFKPQIGSWSLRGTLPRASTPMPESFPDFLQFQPTARWSGAIAGKEGIVSFSASADMTTQLLGAEQAVFVEATLKTNTSNPSASTIALYALIGGDWFSPLGVDWLTLEELRLEGEFGRVLPPNSTTPKTLFAGGVRGITTVAGKNFFVLTSGKLQGDDLNASIELRMDDSVGMGELLGAVRVDTATLPAAVTSPTIERPGIRIEVVNQTNPTPPPAKQRSITLTLTAGGQFEIPTTGFTVGATYLVSVDSAGKLLVGVRSNSNLTINDLLPGGVVQSPINLALAREDGTSAFGFVLSSQPIDQRINTLPGVVRQFYRPLFGRAEADGSDFQLSLPAGASVLGSFELPKELAGIVKTLGAQSRVSASGTLPVFAPNNPVNLKLSLALQSKELLPDIVETVAGSIVVDVHGSPAKLRFGIEGDIGLRFRSGLAREFADPLNAAGIPVRVDAPVTSDATCPSGRPQPVGTGGDHYCFDSLKLSGKWFVEVDPPSGAVKVTLAGGLTTPAGKWHPFGMEWLAIQDLRIELGLAFSPTGVGIEAGILGDLEIGGKDRLMAIKVAVSSIPVPPFVAVELQGIRTASGAGIAISDFFDLQHQIASVAAKNLNGPAPDRLNPADLDIPNIALRNYQFSFSPKPSGVPSLCIPGGLILSGDLYVNPTGNEPRGDPDCKDGSLLIPHEDDQCPKRRADGCMAMGRLGLSAEGILGLLQLPKFDVGPIHLKDATLDVAVTLGDQHLTFAGGAQIDDAVGTDPIAKGALKVDLKTGTMAIFGEMNVLGFQALVDVTGSLNLLTDSNPAFELHVLLASSDRKLAEPSFSTFATQALNVPMVPLRTVAVLANGVLTDLETGGTPLTTLIQLPTRLRNAGLPVPNELTRFSGEAGQFLQTFDQALKHVGGNTLSHVLNGIPPFQVSGVAGTWKTTCYWWNLRGECTERVTVCLGMQVNGGCWVVPPSQFGGAPGICDTVFPASQFPNLRTNGVCTLGGIVSQAVFPVFDKAVSDVLGFTVDTRALIRTVAAAAADPARMLGLNCVEYALSVGANTAASNLSLAGQVLGHPVGFHLGFDFRNPEESAKLLVQDLIRQLLNPGSATCKGLNKDVFSPDDDSAEPKETPGENPRLIVDTPASVQEGERLTLKGRFSSALEAPRTVEISWGDGGAVEQVEVKKGESKFAVEHTYDDDDPSATIADLVTIRVTDLSASGTTHAASVTVRNVAPSPSGLVLQSAAILETATATFKLTFTDPGTADAHTVLIDWGDGTTDETQVPAGERQVDLSHAYGDDDPTATPSDLYGVKVTVVDDDSGQKSEKYQFRVANVAPANVKLETSGTPVDEAGVASLGISWDDPASTDSHAVSIDWGDGTQPLVLQPQRGERQMVVSNTYGDNGTFSVQVKVTDDDTGFVTGGASVTVANVDPRVELDRAGAFTTPSGDTFMRRTGVALSAPVGLGDPGSDDLQLGWTWGDGLADESINRVNEPADDPLPSPTLQPRNVLVARSHTYSRPCLYRLEVKVADDDGGTGVDEAPVVIVGDATTNRSHGWWGEEYRHFDRSGSSAQVDKPTLVCHLAVSRHMSSVLGDAVKMDSAADAAGVLNPDTARGSDIEKRRRTFDRTLLTLWLNVASGSTGTDASGSLNAEFANTVAAAERVRLDPNASASDVLSAQRALEEAERRFSRAR